MFLDLIDVLRAPGQRIERTLDIAPKQLGDIVLAAPVQGTIRVENARRNIVVGGRAKTAITVPCSRCLQPSVQELDLEFEAVAPIAFFRATGFGSTQSGPALQNTQAGIPEEDEEGVPDDELVALFEGHTLDVLELVRQSIELAAPIAPLCSPDCPGLPDSQKYFEAPADNRWSALKQWDGESSNGHSDAASRE